MMKFLVVDDQDSLRVMIVSAIKTIIEDCIVLEAENGESAIKRIIENNDFDLIFCDFEMPIMNGGEVFKYLIEKNKEHLFVLVSSLTPQECPEFNGYNIRAIQKPQIFKPLRTLLAHFGIPKPKYCQIPLIALSKQKYIFWDLYLKLSEEKYVKVFHQTSVFDKSLFERHKRKGIAYLYIEERYVESFYNQIIEDTIKTLDIGDDNDLEGQISSTTVVHEALRVFKVTPEVKQLVDKSVDSILNEIKSSPDLSRILKNLQKDPHLFIASHSVAMSYVAAYMLSYMSWHSEDQYRKLTMAAMLHDCMVQHQDLARLQTLEEIEKATGEYTDEEISDYKCHPQMASEIAIAFAKSDVALEISKIIAQHHECLDGTGFPNGILCDDFTPLSALFIMAHDFVLMQYESKNHVTIETFLKRVQKKFDQGHFRAIRQELQRAFDLK